MAYVYFHEQILFYQISNHKKKGNGVSAVQVDYSLFNVTKVSPLQTQIKMKSKESTDT